MPRKRRIAVEPREGDRWAVQDEGAPTDPKLYDQKGDAVARGVARATHQAAELVVKTADGEVERQETP